MIAEIQCKTHELEADFPEKLAKMTFSPIKGKTRKKEQLILSCFGLLMVNR